ncbi:hypothetical protein M1446_00200 [Candidatus Dependentiae bacterium]|nr:hypothetical protein [Candidatus Dependentiae bacterium]
MKKLFYLIFFFICQIFAYDANNSAIIRNFLNQYRRPITILEITDQPIYYSFELCRYFNITCCLLYLGNRNRIMQDSYLINSNKVVVLNPEQFTGEMLQTLTRCEHFDVSIINVRNNLKMSLESALEYFSKLGDYLFIDDTTAKIRNFFESSYKILDQFSNNKLLAISTPKNGLDIPRWAKKNLPMSDIPRYFVESNFLEKYLIKNAKKTKWIHGINLVTFIMLYGIYPSNEMIIENIYEMKRSGHNDLVVGNMIIQGKTVQLIDFADSRRSLRTRKGVSAAIKLFKDKELLINPYASMQNYGERLT